MAVIMDLLLIYAVCPVNVFVAAKLGPFVFLGGTTGVNVFTTTAGSSTTALPLGGRAYVGRLNYSRRVDDFILPANVAVGVGNAATVRVVTVAFVTATTNIGVAPTALYLATFLSVYATINAPTVPITNAAVICIMVVKLNLGSSLYVVNCSLVLTVGCLPNVTIVALGIVNSTTAGIVIYTGRRYLGGRVCGDGAPGGG